LFFNTKKINQWLLLLIITLIPCMVVFGQAIPRPNLPVPQQAGGGGSGLDKQIQGPVQAADIELNQIMSILQAESGLNLVLGDNVNKKVTFQLMNPTIRQVLDTVLPSIGLAYHVSDSGVVRVDTQEKIDAMNAQPSTLITRVFTPNFLEISQILDALEGLKSEEGFIVPDPDSQKIIVKDIPEAVAAMQQLIQELDVETEYRVFNIKYGDVQEIADQLVGVINTVEGELFINPRLNQIIVRDTPERLDRAAAIIEQLDKDLETRVIPLGFALPEDVLPLIEMYLTEMGYVDFDPRTSRIIIQDIPSVVEKAVELIKLIDIPTQQVYIEADIIQVKKGKSLEFGTSASFGKDIGADGNASSPGVGNATDSASNFFSFNPFLTTSGSGLTLMDVRQGSYRFQIDAMVQNNVAEIIASPRLLVQDAGVGSFTLGSQEPFSSRQRGYGGYGGYGGGDYYTQQFRDVGTTLYIETYISEMGYVEMYINVEDTKARRVQLSNVGEALAIDGSFIDTSVTVKSGRTVVLGGIINRSQERSQSGVPIVSNIPILGNLFRKKSSSSSKDKLLIFITPKIVTIDDPYEFAQIDNVGHVQDLQNKGATKFIETPVDEKYLDWSNEEDNERAAIQDALDEGLVKMSSSTKSTTKKKVPVKEQLDEGVIRSNFIKEE
jgi:type II secretory pathway component GspD/PulD (secretin)